MKLLWQPAQQFPAMDQALYTPSDGNYGNKPNPYIDRVPMTSRWPYWCTKTVKAAMLVNRKKILWGFNCFIFEKILFCEKFA